MQNNPGFIFDMDGTIIDSMAYHLQAWEKTIEDLGGNLKGEALLKQLYGKGNEVLERIFGKGVFTDEFMEHVGIQKEADYRYLYAPHLTLIDGVHNFLASAHKKDIKMAIGTASNMPNVDFVLNGTGIRHYFKAIVSADDVTESKPHPATFLQAAKLIEVLPSNCVVFEDAPKGVEAALRAGMKAVAITTLHTTNEFAGYENIIATMPDFKDADIEKLIYLVTRKN
jgi:beta-phosphoglucomutase